MDIRQSVIPVFVFDVSEGTVACHINGLEQDCGISNGLAIEIQQSCHEPSIYLINMDISLPLLYQHEQGLRLTLIRHWSDTKVSDRCLINIDPKVLALWGTIFPIKIHIVMLCCVADIQIIFWVYWLISMMEEANAYSIVNTSFCYWNFMWQHIIYKMPCYMDL